jgi:hypothetical protein
VKHLHSIPDALTEAQKPQRVALSDELLSELRSVKHHGWQFVITVDEFWFPSATGQQQISLRPDQESLERRKHTTQDGQILVTLAPNSTGFHLGEN